MFTDLVIILLSFLLYIGIWKLFRIFLRKFYSNSGLFWKNESGLASKETAGHKEKTDSFKEGGDLFSTEEKKNPYGE